jgi:O-antigen/teichoic acid export membrane protein
MSEESQGLTRRALSGMFWTAWGSGASAALRVVVLIALARLLSPADFGVVGAALVVITLSTAVSQLGLGPALVQRQTLSPAHIQTAFVASALLGLGLAGLLWICAPLLSLFFHMQSLTPVLRVLALLFPLRGIGTVAECLLQRDLRFRWLANAEVVTYGLGFGVLGILLAWLGWGMWSLVVAQLAQTLLYAVLLLIARRPSLRPSPTWPAFKDLLSFGGGFTAARLANLLADQGDNLVVGRTLGAAPLGLYTRAFQLMAVPATLFGNILDRVLFPTMARKQHDLPGLAAAYDRGCAAIALGMLPISAVMLVLAPETIRVAFGPRWLGVVAPFQIFAVGIMFRTSYRMSDSLARATGAVYRRAWRQILFAGLVVGCAWVGSRWGITGVAWGVLASHITNFFFMAHLSLRVTHSRWRDFAVLHLPAIALATIAGLIAWATVAPLRAANLPPVLRLAAATLTAVLGGGALAARFPSPLLGSHGMWIRDLVLRYLPRWGTSVAPAPRVGR